jgi:eukaryotic-like serine/threonine-protein kinase
VNTPTTIGRYQIVKPLEAGGMGQVLLARDPAIDRLVAIKLLKEGFDNPELRERFMREARSAGRLRHINIVTIFDVGEHDSQPFIAMEYVEGETLHALIRRRTPLTLGRKIQLMEELCAGLHYAHRAGIVHRDIKPKNVMLDADGVLKVLDFGIARLADSGASIKTQAGLLMGTLNYMSPEQMMGLPDIDARADMFSAGALFYELLTSQQAFPGGLESGILHRIINVAPEPLATLDPALDPGLAAIVTRCLEKAKENRYPDMAAVRRDLAAARRRLGVDLDEEHSHTIAVTRPSTPDEGTPAPTPRPARRDSSRQELDRLRAAQIRTHLDEARTALDSGNFTAALEAAQRALLLNGEERDALDYEHRARTGLDDREAQQLLLEARSEIDRGALTAASLLVGRAESLSPASREAAAVRAALDEARRQQADQQARARAFEAALTQARDALAAGSLDEAGTRVREALALDAGNDVARGIERDVNAAIDARRRADEQLRVRNAVQAAREQFAAGRLDDAIAQLERFQPRALVADALAELRVERDEILRLRRESERKVDAPAARVAASVPPPQWTAGTAASDATIVLPTPPAAAPEPAPAPEPAAPPRPAPPRPARKPGISVATYIGLAVAALLASGIGAWMYVRSSRYVDTTRTAAVPAVPGSVVLDVAPWANIDAVTRKPDGQVMTTNCTVTPCVASLPPGAYHVKASNPNFPAPIEFDIAVDAGGLRYVRESIPGFRPEDEVSKILDK